MGCFDTVKFMCPFCQELTDVQSKAGSCSLTTYIETDVPSDIAKDLNNSTESCDNCKAAFKIVAVKEIKNIRMSAVPYYKED